MQKTSETPTSKTMKMCGMASKELTNSILKQFWTFNSILPKPWSKNLTNHEDKIDEKLLNLIAVKDFSPT